MRPPSRRGRFLAAAGLVLVAGLAAARFVAYDDAPSRDQGVGAAGASGGPLAEVSQAAERRPDDPRAWQALGEASLRQAVQTLDPAYYGVSSRAYERAAALAPDDPRTLVGRGALALSLHRFADALTFGTRAHEANPDDPDALAVVVDANVELGRYDEAADALQRLLDRRPGAAALARVSYLRELRGDLDGAAQALGRAATAGAGTGYDAATVLALLGDLEFGRGRLDAARAAYDEAQRAAPDHVAAAVGHARVSAARGERAAAIESLRRVTQRVPQPAAIALLGELLELEGRADEARRSYELVGVVQRLQESSGAVADLELALFQADHGDPAEAVALARRAHAERPTVYAADALAWALHRAGDASAARPYAEEALRLGSADALVRYHAAVVFSAAGDAARAGAELRTAFATNPWFSFGLRAEALALAERLGVPPPDAWGARS